MKKLKENKKVIFAFILGLLIAGTTGVLAVTYYASKDVTYDNSASGMTSENVQDAIDELYKLANSKPATDFITSLVVSSPDELYTDEHGDIRYYGANPNNYVRFNNELWRIMGVIDGKIKIVRNESIGNYAWDSSNSNNWNNSSLKSYLNGDYYNSIEEVSRNMISSETYYLGGPTHDNYNPLTASGYYNTERDGTQVYGSNPTSTTQYIGLMYPSDYGYAAGESCLSTALYNYNTSCKNTDYLHKVVTQWLQATDASGTNVVTGLNSTGRVTPNYLVTNSYAVFPVLYLKSQVEIVEGEGNNSSPYLLSQ